MNFRVLQGVAGQVRLAGAVWRGLGLRRQGKRSPARWAGRPPNGGNNTTMRFAVGLLAVLVVLGVAASGRALLQACGLRLPLTGTVLSWCETPQAQGLRDRQADEDRITGDLGARIAALERDLARLECRADPPPPPLPPLRPKPRPEPPETPSGLDPDAFEDDDISVMEGCWQLSSDYAVREIRTGLITEFRYWRICFDAAGNGTQEMRATNGVSCKGTVSGRLAGDGRLTMRESGNLKCDNSSEIYRRDITCTLDASGTARCETYQPEVNGRGVAILRRAGR